MTNPIDDISSNDKLLDGSIADAVDASKVDYSLFVLSVCGVGLKTSPQLKGRADQGAVGGELYKRRILQAGCWSTNTYGILGYTRRISAAAMAGYVVEPAHDESEEDGKS